MKTAEIIFTNNFQGKSAYKFIINDDLSRANFINNEGYIHISFITHLAHLKNTFNYSFNFKNEFDFEHCKKCISYCPQLLCKNNFCVFIEK